MSMCVYLRGGITCSVLFSLVRGAQVPVHTHTHSRTHTHTFFPAFPPFR